MSNEAAFWARVNTTPTCWLWTGSHLTSGYGTFYRPNGKRTTAHRVSWEDEHGPIPDGQLVLHHCDNPPCVRPDHLFLGTAADNMADMRVKGRAKLYHPNFGDANGSRHYPPKGERNGHAKLTETSVRLIRALADRGWSYPKIGQTFMVSRSTVGDIVLRKRWSHV